MPSYSAQVLTETSPATNVIAAGTLIAKNLEGVRGLIQATLTLQGATGGTLNVTLQDSDDNGTTWYDWFRSADIAAGAAATTVVVTQWHGAGTPVTIGSALVPALAKGTVRPGPVRPWMRVVFEAGASTSAGASQTILISGAS